MKEKIITHHRWLKIDYSDCPSWLKNAVKNYESRHKPRNQIVNFKGMHFRYKVFYNNLSERYKIERRLRYRYQVESTKQDNTHTKKIVGTRGEGKMDEKQLFDLCGLSYGDDFEKIKNNLLWKTVGKNGNSPPHWVKLIDCDTDHLENIIYNVSGLLPITKKVILSILQDRWKKGERGLEEIKLKIEKWKKEGYDVSELEKMVKNVNYT